MKSIAAASFKDRCLRLLDEVARTKSGVIITKRGHPVAKLVPCDPVAERGSLSGSILREKGDPFSTRAAWDADPS